MREYVSVWGGCIRVGTYVCVLVCPCAYVYVCLCARVCPCGHLCMYVCVRVYTCVCACRCSTEGEEMLDGMRGEIIV